MESLIDFSGSSTSNLNITYTSSDETVTKVPNGTYRCVDWFYYFTIRNDYYLAAREAKRSFTINKAVLNVKPDDKRIIQRKTQHLRYYNVLR
jgi:hypothetical protein